MKTLTKEESAELTRMFETIELWAINSRHCQELVETYGPLMDKLAAEWWEVK